MTVEIAKSLTTQDHKARGEIFAKCLFFGNITPDQGAAISIICEESGISIGEWMTSNNIVHDRPSMKADAMLAGFAKIGGRYTIAERSSERAAVAMEIDGRTYEGAIAWSEIRDEPYTKVRDKKTGEMVTNPKYATPRSRMQMLWARLVSDAVRTVAPQVNQGMYTPEEVEDFSASASVPAPAATASEPQEERPKRVERPKPAPAETAPPATEAQQPAATTQPDAELWPKDEAKPNAAPAPDYTIMPVGGSKGTPFAQMPAGHLAVVLKAATSGQVPGLTAEYIPAIEAALAANKEG